MNTIRGRTVPSSALSVVIMTLLSPAVPARGQCQPVWSPVGTGVGVGGSSKWVQVRTFAAFDDGTGLALYAGGLFDTMDGVPVNNLAKWNGANWLPVGGGVTESLTADPAQVDCLRVLDLGSGPVLLVGGNFKYARDVEVNGLAQWDGQCWTALGAGLTPATTPSWMKVYDMLMFDDGSGPALWVGGDFSAAGGVGVTGLAKWNGDAWSAGGTDLTVTSGSLLVPIVGALRVCDDGSGAALYVGGYFDHAGGVAARNVARWNGSAWSALGTGLPRIGAFYPAALGLQELPYGSGTALYANGCIGKPSDLNMNGLARWDGTSWTWFATFHSTFTNSYAVTAIQPYTDESGPALYACGVFDEVIPLDQTTPVAAKCIVRWDGTNFSAVGAGLDGTSTIYRGRAQTMTVFDDGTGAALYAGGLFETAGDVAAHGIARWGCLYGDMNCDGLVNNQDIDGFLAALFGRADLYDAYLHSFTEYRPCSMLNADFTRDGFVNSQDIDGFILRLFAP